MDPSTEKLATELRLRIDYEIAHFLKGQRDAGGLADAASSLVGPLRGAMQREAVTALAARLKLLAEGAEPGQLVSYQLTRNFMSAAEPIFAAAGVIVAETGREDFAAQLDRLVREVIDERGRTPECGKAEPRLPRVAPFVVPHTPVAPSAEAAAAPLPPAALTADMLILQHVVPLADRFVGRAMAEGAVEFRETEKDCRNLVSLYALSSAFNRIVAQANGVAFSAPPAARDRMRLIDGLQSMLRRLECKVSYEDYRQLANEVDAQVEAAVALAAPAKATGHAAALESRSKAARSLGSAAQDR